VNAISQGDDRYVIDASKCIECNGHFDEPQCASVCPTESCVKK
jgi:ferredoxin